MSQNHINKCCGLSRRSWGLAIGSAIVAISLIALTLCIQTFVPLATHNERIMRFAYLYDSLCFYDHNFGHLPKSVSLDDNNVPLYSWRFELLPYLTHIDYIDMKSAWNSPVNSSYSEKARIFYCSTQKSTYLEDDAGTITALVSSESAIRQTDPISLSSIPSDTILFLEGRPHADYWMAPGDTSLGLEKMVRVKRYSGIMVCFADGEVWHLNDLVTDEVLSEFSSVKPTSSRNRDASFGKYKISVHKLGSSRPLP